MDSERTRTKKRGSGCLFLSLIQIIAVFCPLEEMQGSSNVPGYLPVPSEVTPSKELHSTQETFNINGCEQQKASQVYITHKSPSLSWDAELTPTKARKKKKKSSRKKRRRSDSPSPLKKKKKKKKKNSKKRKRNRISSKKRRHSFSSPKRKRKAERKHKKHSRDRPSKSQRCHHHHRGSSDRSSSLLERCRSRLKTRLLKEGRKERQAQVQRSSKMARKADGAAEMAGSPFLRDTPQNNGFLSATEVISNIGSAVDLFDKTAGLLGKQVKQNRDLPEYDSGNATSSPPSIQTSSSRSKDSHGNQDSSRAFSSAKACDGSSPDSGNSFSSYTSQSKGPTTEEPQPFRQGLSKEQKQTSRSSLTPPGKKRGSFVSPVLSGSPRRPSLRNESSSSASSLESLWHHKVGRRSSLSRSCCSSETRCSSRSPSYCRRGSGSRSSRSQRSPSYFRSRPGRSRKQDHHYGSGGKESHRHQDRWQRKQSYSPMRKRRRDSPSHLEARRITSARKRPIPYYRPSPSSSPHSSTSPYSSWSSSLSDSPSRGRTPSGDRSSRRRSWNSWEGSDQSPGGSSRRSDDFSGSEDSGRH